MWVSYRTSVGTINTFVFQDFGEPSTGPDNRSIPLAQTAGVSLGFDVTLGGSAGSPSIEFQSFVLT